MRAKLTQWLGLLVLAMVASTGGAAAAQAADDSQEVAAKALLEKAVAYYRVNGDAAFAAFSRQGDFIDGERYVFVVDTHGVMLASGGPSGALIGRNVSDVIGPDLRKNFQSALATPEEKGIQEGEYRWQNWADGRVERKRVFFQRVGERVLAVGYYLPRASAAQAQALLGKAATALAQDEQGTLTAINNLRGGFLEDDLYVFIVDTTTHRYVAHGYNLRLVNIDFRTIKDPDGKPVGEPMLALAEKGDGISQYPYRWRNPVTGKTENKHAYLRKVGHYMVAVGYYSN